MQTPKKMTFLHCVGRCGQCGRCGRCGTCRAFAFLTMKIGNVKSEMIGVSNRPCTISTNKCSYPDKSFQEFFKKLDKPTNLFQQLCISIGFPNIHSEGPYQGQEKHQTMLVSHFSKGLPFAKPLPEFLVLWQVPFNDISPPRQIFIYIYYIYMTSVGFTTSNRRKLVSQDSVQRIKAADSFRMRI